MIRQAFSHVRKTVAAATFGAALALTPAPAHAFWDTKKAWNDLLQFAVKQVNAPGEFEIILGEVTKPEEGFALISTLQIKDSDGVWLDASNLLVDWSASALLRGRFIFETLSAEEIAILRAPIGRGDPPADEAQVAFAWPRPPVPIGIDALKVDRLRIEGGLLPQDIEAQITGSFRDIGDVQDAELVVQRTDRPEDRITLTSRIDFDDLDIAFKLTANEEPGGLVASMASLPPDQALELALEAKGTPKDLPFQLYADIGQIGIAEGKGTTSFDGLTTVKFDGRIEPGEETSADWRRALGEAALIKVDFAEESTGTYDLRQLEIDSPAFELDGKGKVDVAGNSIDLALDWDAKDIAAFNQVIAPASVTELNGTARAIGRLSAPKLDVNAKVAGLDAAFGKADAILLRIDSEPLTQNRETPGAPQGFTFEARADGLTLADGSLQEALGPTPSFSGNGQFNGVENRITLETLKIDARSVQLDGNASYDIATGAADAELSGEARELGPFLKAAGVPVDGRAALAFKLDGLQGGTLDRLFLNAQMTNLSSTDPDIAAALGEEAVLELLLTESGVDAIQVERGFFESNVLRAEASGTVSIPGDTVDLEIDFDVLDAEAIGGLIAPARVGDAQGKATLTGSLSEPQASVNAMATGIGFEDYAADSARIDGSVQYRKDRRAPFSLTAALEGVKTGDVDLDAVVGPSPRIETAGLYDTATGLLSLSKMEADLADADLSLTGDVHLRKKTLDVTYDLKAGDLGGFSGLVGKPLDGSVDIAGRAEGPFSLPFVTAKGTARNLRYDTYSVEAVDLDVEMLPGEDAPAPFRVDVTAVNPKTGDAALDALIGENPSLRAKGTLDRMGPAVTLDYLDADLATVKAQAKGSVNIGTRLMDLTFDVEATELDGLTGLLGTEIAGAVTAKGTARGSFTTPEIDATVDAARLRYGDYAVGSVVGSVDIQQAPSGFAPFDIDIEARDVTTGDAALDDLLAGASTVTAKGEFNQSEQKVRLESATVIAAGAIAGASGDIDIAGKALNVAFSLNAEDLSAFEGLAGAPLAGALKAKGTAKGPFNIPKVNATLNGRTLRYENYRIARLDGTVAMDAAKGGVSPFDIDVKASGIRTGDAALDEAIGGTVQVDAAGGFDPKAQVLRLDAATLTSGLATADLSGRVDLARKTLDLTYDLDASRLAALSAVLDTDIAGAVAMKGTAKGPFSLPALDTTLTGRGIAYGPYGIARLDGRIDTKAATGDALPFDVDLTAAGITTGDPAFDEALGETVRVDARGRFDRAAQVLRLTEAALSSDFAEATAGGTVNLGAKTLDLAFDLDAKRLAALGPLANAELGGSVTVSGTAKGAFVIPVVDATIDGNAIRFNQYTIGRLDGSVDVGQAVNGALPFDVEMTAAGLTTGDAALDETIGDAVTLDAAGTFAPEAQVIVLDTARFRSDFATANASGRADLKAQTLDMGFDLEAADLSPFSAVTGEAMAGSVALRGTARGPFNIPAVDATIAARGLAFGTYGAGQLDGALSLGLAQGGMAPFTVDMEGNGLSLGDPALDAAFGSRVDIDAAGGLDVAQRRIRLDRARLATDAATAALNGSVDLSAKTVDLTFDVEAASLAPFGPLASADLAGSVALKGRATGPFVIPRVNASLAGAGIRYNQYTVARIDGTVDMASPENGVTPFTIGLTAAGIGTGDPALDDLIGPDLRLAANGGFDQGAKLLRLDDARVTSALAQASARGTVDLAAQSLDLTYGVDAGEIAPLSGLIGADMAGALSLGGSVSGPFASPSVAATLNGRALRYQQYTVASLNGTASFSQAANGYGPFAIDAVAAGIGTGDPSLDFALEDGVSIDAAGGFDAGNQRLRLDRFTAQARFASVSASGLVDLGMTSMDVTFALDADDLSPLSAVVGKPLGGSLKASGTARGSFTAPVVNMTAQGGGLYFDQYSLGGLTLDLAMPGDVPGYLPFTLTGTASQPRLNNPNLEYLIGETITLRAEGVFDPTRQLLRMTDTQVQTASAWVGALGDVDLANRMLAVDYYANLLDLSVAQPLAGKPLAGAARLRGRIAGSMDDPATSGQLTGQNIVYDQYRVTTVTMGYDLQRLVSGPAGAVSLDGQTEFGPLTASARFDLTGGALQIQQVSVSGLGLGLEGSFRSGPNGTLDGSATLTATDLAQLGAFLGQDIAGRVDGSITLNGEQGRQGAVFDVRGSNFRYGPAANPTAQFAIFEARGQVADAFGRDPYVDATFGGSNGKIVAFPVKQIDATARGTLSALDTTLSARGGELGSDKVELAARVNAVNPPRSAYISRLALAFDGRNATIIEPLIVEEVVPGGFRIRNLDLRAEDGEVRGSAEYGPSGLVADLTIRNFPLALASLSGVDLIRSGRLDGDVDIDTRGGVRGTFEMQAMSLRLKGAQIDDPFAVVAKGVMDGQALNVTAEMTGAQLVQPLVAKARIPLRPAAGSPLPAPDMNAPFSAAVDWTGDVGEIWAFVPLPDHILSGPVVINGRAGGTLAAPRLSGGASLTDGRYSNIEFGTLLTNLNAKADFTQDGRVVFDLTGNDGVQGTIAASGSYVVASSTLDSRLSLNNAALVRRDDATAILSGQATAISQGRDIKVDGQFRTNYVEVRLIGNFGSSLTVVDAIPVGESAPLYNPPVESTEAARNIFLNVSLDLPNRVFVRGRGLDSEWGGRLNVTGSAAKPRINGAIERRRGFLDLLGKQFELSIGIVRFSGGTNPFVQVRLQREDNDLIGWIEVVGTAPDLDIGFGSIPDLPEGEILPRLLFGRSKQSLTALEAAQLAAGVATLLSGKAGVLDTVRDAVGVDVLRVESDVDGGTSVITGKYLRDEVFVGAKQNLQSGQTSGLVEVEVFDNFEIEAELGSEEAKGSVGWQIEY